jgi:dihydrofolate synthase/folylpolyglutamate synthase
VSDTPPPAGDQAPTAVPEDLEAMQRIEAALATRWPESDIDPTLARMRAVTNLLDHPERSYPVIQITGTNGKTTTARMIESLLRALNLRTGRFTSPHLDSYTERISIDGKPVPIERFVGAYDEVIPYVELVDRDQPVRMSFFEVLTVMGYAAFADAPVDVAVVEVGLGGRWDATNVADASVAVITPISLDHERYLGDDVASIAEEKSGIIKPGAIAVIAEQPLAAAEVIMRHAAEYEATVAREGIEFGVLSREIAVGGQLLDLQGLGGRYDEVFLPLFGEHQAHNASCALAAVEAFFGVGSQREGLDVEVIREGFASVTSPGRLEVVRRSPTVLVDAAHNPAGTRAAVEAVREAFRFTRLVGVVSILRDKDIRGILGELEPLLDEIVITENDSHRRVPADELAAIAVDIFGADRVTVVQDFAHAVETAIALAEAAEDITGVGVLAIGSVITAGNARRLLKRSRGTT